VVSTWPKEIIVTFQIQALPQDTLQSLFAALPQDLAKANAELVHVSEPNSVPCRVSLQCAEPGEKVILASFVHQPANSPYYAKGPIFVRRSAKCAQPSPGEIPHLFLARPMSVRAYDE
jgi:hypothetical protein